ncbi:hypothetical protein H6G27_10280 [Nostoc linckia FACHB-104]|nr:hypothetical protein [Nostoc linckia FACHB-104]
MKNSQAFESENNDDDELLPEYDFDYRKAKPNRFARPQEQTSVTVILDPDVAEVFKTSAYINHALRALLTAIPKTEK